MPYIQTLKKTLRPLFMDVVQRPQGYRATTRRQPTFYHWVPRKSWYTFDRPRKDERLSRPWRHSGLLKKGPLDWGSSALATKPDCFCLLIQFMSYSPNIHHLADHLSIYQFRHPRTVPPRFFTLVLFCYCLNYIVKMERWIKQTLSLAMQLLDFTIRVFRKSFSKVPGYQKLQKLSTCPYLCRKKFHSIRIIFLSIAKDSDIQCWPSFTKEILWHIFNTCNGFHHNICIKITVQFREISTFLNSYP